MFGNQERTVVPLHTLNYMNSTAVGDTLQRTTEVCRVDGRRVNLVVYEKRCVIKFEHSGLHIQPTYMYDKYGQKSIDISQIRQIGSCLLNKHFGCISSIVHHGMNQDQNIFWTFLAT